MEEVVTQGEDEESYVKEEQISKLRSRGKDVKRGLKEEQIEKSIQ